MIGRDNIALAIWLAAIFAIVCLFYLVCYAYAATLSLSGSFAGQGFTNISVEADLLMASINQTTNGTSWQIWGAPA